MKSKVAFFSSVVSSVVGLLFCVPSMAQKPSAATSTTKVESEFYGLQRPHFGITAGVSTPEGNYDSSGEIGLNFGYQPYVPFGIGASISATRNEPRDSRPDIERTTVLGRATYNFGGETPVIRHSWVGVAAGPVFSDDGTDFAAAPILGFDIPVSSELTGSFLSVGAEAQYLVVSNEQPDSLGVNAVVKFWY